MLVPPLHLIFRDPSSWIFDGVTLNPMAKRAGRSGVHGAIYCHHPMFADEEFKIWHGGVETDWGRPRSRAATSCRSARAS